MPELISESFLKSNIGKISMAGAVYAISQVIYSLSQEDLATLKYPSSIAVVYIFSGFLLLVWLFAFIEKQPILPQNYRPQMIRFFNTGFGTWLITESYTHLPASSVSLIQRSEIPLAILLAYMLGTRGADRQVKFSFVIMLVIIGFAIFSEWQSDDAFGVGIAQLGVLSSVLGYYLMQRSFDRENQYTILTVSGLSCLFYGIVISTINNNWQFIRVNDLGIVLAGTFGIFFMFKSVSVLYKTKSLEYARFPALIGSVLILFGEQIHEHDLFSYDYICIVLAITGLIYWLLFKVKIIKNS
jgi:drug/metabolite transporter (DMT)-like permease